MTFDLDKNDLQPVETPPEAPEETRMHLDIYDAIQDADDRSWKHIFVHTSGLIAIGERYDLPDDHEGGIWQEISRGMLEDYKIAEDVSEDVSKALYETYKQERDNA